ncbi:MAG: 4Fe-4S binding protein, partial [candidate division WOR-3 bacterium]
MRPYRIGQVMSLVLLNCYILAYTQRKIIYTGIFKSIPEPVLNCYGGPLAVFACPLGSLQQIIGIHQIPWLILGVFGLVGVLVGRMACGWVCPFGLWQDLLQKIPTGRAAGSRRWLAWAGMLAAAAALVLVLTLVFRVPARELILLGWLPFGLLSLVVIMLGKRGMPSRLWLGGLLGGIGLGVLVWARFGASFGVVAGVTGMALLGLTGRWFAAVTVSMGGFVVMLLGTPIHTTTVVGQLGLAILVAGLGGGLVLVLDLVLGVSRPGHYLKYAYLVVVAILVA